MDNIDRTILGGVDENSTLDLFGHPKNGATNNERSWMAAAEESQQYLQKKQFSRQNGGSFDVPLGNSMESVQSASTSYSQPSANYSQKMVLEEDRTMVLGIRSVLINGNRFYQPVEVVNRSQDPPQRRADEPLASDSISMPILATALQIINNNQRHSNHSNSENSPFTKVPLGQNLKEQNGSLRQQQIRPMAHAYSTGNGLQQLNGISNGSLLLAKVSGHNLSSLYGKRNNGC